MRSDWLGVNDGMGLDWTYVRVLSRMMVKKGVIRNYCTL